MTRLHLTVLLLGLALLGACATRAPDRRAPSPETIEAWRDSRRLRDAGRIDEALARLEAARGWDPVHVPAHRDYQEILRVRGLGHVAYEEYRREVEKRPDRAEAAYLLGRMLGDPGAQEAAFRRAIRLDPELSWGHHGLATVMRRRGALDAARDGYRRALELAPTEADHAYAFADLELERGDLSAAEVAAERVLASDPGDPRGWSLLARVRRRAGDATGALAACENAVRLAPESAWYRRQRREIALAGASAPAIRWVAADEESRGEVPDALRNAGRCRIRLGDLAAGVAMLEKAEDLGADLREAVRPWRSALVRLGRLEEALRVDSIVVPAAFRTAAGNERAAEWSRLTAAIRRKDPGSPASLLEIGRALRGVGWIDESAHVLRGALVASPGNADITRELGRSLAVREVAVRLASAVDRGYRTGTGPAENLDDLLLEAGRWFAHASLPGDPAAAERIGYPFVGDLVDGGTPGNSPLHDTFLDSGLLLLLGRRNGATAEALLGEAVSVERGRRVQILGRDLVHDRYVVAHIRLGSRRGAAGEGEPAGLAMEGFDLLLLDEISDRPYGGSGPGAVPLWRPSDPDDRTSLDWPGGVLTRLGAGLPAESRAVRLDVVIRHEEGHLLDAERYLPIEAHPFRGIGLAVSAGFDPREVQGRLEGDAQLVALAAAREPRAALHGLISLGVRRESAPPHSLGYHDALREIVDEIADHPDRFPRIDREANVLQQLDRLPDDEIRELARRLLERRGLP